MTLVLIHDQLALNGNQLNYFTTYFNIGYIIIVPLSTYVINDRIRPSLWLPTAECKLHFDGELRTSSTLGNRNSRAGGG